MGEKKPMINFETPLLLLLLPLPFLVRKFLSPVVAKWDSGLKVPFYTQLTHLNYTMSLTKNVNWPLLIACIVWLLLVLAAAGPVLLGKPVDLPRSGRDIMLAIDVSGSMEIPDMQINDQPADRLSVVKQVAQQFIHYRKGDRLGLILFGTRAYLETPLTFDLKTVEHMLLDASVGLAGTQTAIGDAIGMGIKHLKNYPKNNKVLVLLTDGVNNEGAISPLDAAKIAAQYGIRIYTIGLGANKIVVPTVFGPTLVNSDYELDEDTLKQIADTTQGVYFRAKNPEDLLNVYDQLNQLEPRTGDADVFRPKTPLYYWPLGIAFCLTLLTIFWQLRDKLLRPFVQRLFNMNRSVGNSMNQP